MYEQKSWDVILHLSFFIGVFSIGNCYAQTRERQLDSTINSLHRVYQNVIFYDNLKDDTDRMFPVHWRVYNTYQNREVRDRLTARIKTVNSAKALALGFTGNWYHIYPIVDNKRLTLPDSFILEFDFIYGQYVTIVDTEQISSRANIKNPVDEKWPHVYYDKKMIQHHPSIDTTRKYAVPVFSSSYNYSAWHHCIILSSHKKVTCFITNPKPYIAFTDSAFDFRHMGMAHPGDVLYRDISIKTAGENNFNSILTKKKFVTHAILFDVDKATIKAESFSFLKEFSAWLKLHPSAKIEIAGHTDGDGTSEHNLSLSKQRSTAIKLWLTESGVEAVRLTTNGFGATMPVASNSTSEGKANNRRVEFTPK